VYINCLKTRWMKTRWSPFQTFQNLIIFCFPFHLAWQIFHLYKKTPLQHTPVNVRVTNRRRNGGGQCLNWFGTSDHANIYWQINIYYYTTHIHKHLCLCTISKYTRTSFLPIYFITVYLEGTFKKQQIFYG